MRLPLEVIERVYEYLPFEKVVCLSKRVAEKIYDPDVHTWEYVLDQYDVYIPVLEFLNEKDYYGMDEFIVETIIFKQKHVLIWFLENKREYFTNDIVVENLLGGHRFETLEFMLYNNFDMTDMHISNMIISNDSVEILIWLHRKNIKIPNHVLFRAIRNNLMVIIEWFATFYQEAFKEIDIPIALLNSTAEVIYYVYNLGFRDFTNFHIENAISKNDFELVMFYDSLGLKIKNHNSCYSFIARNGNMNLLRYMYYMKNHREIPSHALSCAAGQGNLEILKWFVEKGYVCGKEAIECAIMNGHFHVVEWLYENTFIDPSSQCLKAAVKSENLEMVKWLYDNNKVVGIPDPDVMSEAVYHSCFEILKYFAEKGGVCGNDATDMACKNDRMDILEWLLERGHTVIGDCVYSACENGNLEMLKLLMEHQEIDGHGMVIAAENNYIDIINFLHSTGMSVTPLVIKAAVNHGHFELVKWLYELLDKEKYYSYINSLKLVDSAIHENCISMAKWLIIEKNLYITFDSISACVSNGNIGMLVLLFNRFHVKGSLPEQYLKKLIKIASSRHFWNIEKILN